MTNWDTLVQILGHDSHNKYSFQATDQVRNFMLTLLHLNLRLCASVISLSPYWVSMMSGMATLGGVGFGGLRLIFSSSKGNIHGKW